MEQEIFVYIDIEATPLPVGRLWARARGKKESASFEYDKNWLNRQDRFALEPALMVGEGVFHTGGQKPMFGAIGDSAPDRWGRALMRRAERRKAEAERETPRTLFEADYLLMVNDLSRQGALRFAKEPGGTFLADDGVKSIPPLIELPKLLSASENIAEERETAEELKLLLAPGSSLGGARPKASVWDRDGRLCLAKFPHKEDNIDIIKWEAVALTLASKAGIEVPGWRVEKVGRKSVLVLKRFDRKGRGKGQSRIPFLSAMSMLEARDNETHSYLEMADALRQHGTSPREDLQALWKRMIFNILISNTDDHLRNHGFLYANEDGWRLSPVYDLNPVPVDLSPRILSTNISEDDGTCSLELAYEVAPFFELNEVQAKKIARKVGRAASRWKEIAGEMKLSRASIKRMSSAFEHQDLELALRK